VISFRYHIVSIIAVFLALSLGIVVGTTALNGPITADLRRQVDSLKKDRASLAGQVNSLQGQVSDAEKFADTYGSQIVNGTLSGFNALVIGLPGAQPSTKDAITKQIAAAGGKVSGRIQITSDYVDPKRAGDITSLTVSTHPLGLVLPNTDDSGALGGALLSFVLVGKGQPTDMQQVLAGFASLHMVKVESADNVQPAKLVVLVTSGGLRPGDAGGKTQLALITELARSGAHVVVAGDTESATANGVIALVRADDTDKGAVSTVDNADSSLGQVSTVLAMAAAQGNRFGHFGTGKGVDALFPDPAK
jgi:Copper transport outer membrane protein, MctB